MEHHAQAIFITALLLSSKTLNADPARPSSPASSLASLSPTTAVVFDFAGPVSEPFWETLQGELDQNSSPWRRNARLGG